MDKKELRLLLDAHTVMALREDECVRYAVIKRCDVEKIIEIALEERGDE